MHYNSSVECYRLLRFAELPKPGAPARPSLKYGNEKPLKNLLNLRLTQTTALWRFRGSLRGLDSLNVASGCSRTMIRTSSEQ